MSPQALASRWWQWWKRLTAAQRFLPLVLVVNYWLALWLLKGFRQDHLNIGIAVLLLSYLGPGAHRLRYVLLPFLLTGVIYDSQRFYSDYLRGPVHVTEPYHFDLRFFGIPTSEGVLTPNEWWQRHTNPALDLITGFAYLIFVLQFIGVALYFRFWLPRVAPTVQAARRLREKVQGMIWGFFWLNMLGYSTYYWYAAAPPWYVSMHGLGPAKMDVQANPAGCARFDEMLGTHFFTGMYGRAADVFGAIPSLHVAYPLLAAYFAFKFGRARVFTVAFYFLMCFSAVYLNHHYVLDLIWGSVYALIIGKIINKYYDWKLAVTS